MLQSIRLKSISGIAMRGLCVVTAGGIALTVLPASPVQAAPALSSVGAPVLPRGVVGLRLGSSGADVKQVQEALVAAGIRVIGGADGMYGPITAAAVKQFQTSKGLAATGTVDSATAAALGIGSGGSSAPAVSTSTGELAYGARGDAVKALQQALMDAGVYVAGGADGSFGRATRAAVENYQKWNGLTVTGTLTADTAKRLGLSSVSSSASSGSQQGSTSSTNAYVGLRIGARSSLVKDLQNALMNAGITVSGGADGGFGIVTHEALKEYQRAHQMTASGRVDEATAQKLGLGSGSAPVPPAASSGSDSASGSYVGMKIGASGDAVKELQRALMQTGFTLLGGADGVFGKWTQKTLMEFQRSNGISQTGEVTSKGAGILGLGTTSSAQPAASTSGYPVFGENGSRVRGIQQALLNKGISFAGGADGKFGAATANAIMEFQRHNGLPVTGKIDAATAAKLGSAEAPAPAPPSSSGSGISVFPVQGQCWYGNTWRAPRGGGRTHQGVDIIAAKGKLLYAVADGRLTKQYIDAPGSMPGNGWKLTATNGAYYLYLHMDGFAPGLGVGSPVKAGQVIGYVGSTGSSGTPHVHFEVHPGGGAAVNPYPVVKAVDACNVTTPRA